MVYMKNGIVVASKSLFASPPIFVCTRVCWSLFYQRLQDMTPRVNTLALGCGALAGHAYGIDREFLRKELGFESITLNSMVCMLPRLCFCACHNSKLSVFLVASDRGGIVRCFGFLCKK